jgi:hypothetical protein
VLDLGRVTDEERRWLYANARLVLFPSLYEGFGLVPFEAAACGTPCVYGWRSSLPEFLPESGAVLEGWDLDRCTPDVFDLLTHERSARVLTDAIREAGSFLTWDETARGYLEVYRRALLEPQRQPSSYDEPALRALEAQAGELTEPEARLLAVYRRRGVFRTTIDAAIGSGVVGMDAARRVARRARTPT